jgi:LmbE family N-acetylglucosaminyl deacetylase
MSHTIAVLTQLPAWHRPLAVVAHPDDESFGLGAILSAFAAAGSSVSVLCFTHGEASTLHGVDGDLREIRARELADAAACLGVDTVRLLEEPDGALGRDGDRPLVDAVLSAVADVAPDGLIVFDDDGITGHPDHIAATRVTLAAADRADLPVLAWALPTDVTQILTSEFGIPFVGRSLEELDGAAVVDRTAQNAAVQAHPSQAVPGSALWRRLELQGGVEHLRWLRRP